MVQWIGHFREVKKKKMSRVAVRKLAVRRLWSECRRLGFLMKLGMVNIWGWQGWGG